MELHENRTELERMLADVWDYEDPGGRKTSLPKWLFAVTLTGAVLCTSSPLEVAAPVLTALSPAPERLAVDTISSENVAEDLDYRIARRSDSPAGWRAFLAAHPNGPHAQAARAEVDGLAPAPPSEQAAAAEQSPPSAGATEAPVEAGQPPTAPAPPPEQVGAADQSPPSDAPTLTSGETAQTASPAPVLAETEPAPASQPAEVAEQSPAAEQTTVVAETEPASPSEPAEAAANPPRPPLRPHETAVARSAERARHSHWRIERHQANQPNVFTILVAQLFHPHRQRSDLISDR